MPGASGPRLTELNPLGLQVRCFKPLTRPEQPEHSCRWQLWYWPDNDGTIPGKSAFFTPSSILVRPRRNPSSPGFGWSRRVLPPGPKGLLQRPFIAISGLRRHPEYRRDRLTKKEPLFGSPGEGSRRVPELTKIANSVNPESAPNACSGTRIWASLVNSQRGGCGKGAQRHSKGDGHAPNLEVRRVRQRHGGLAALTSRFAAESIRRRSQSLQFATRTRCR